MLLLLSKQHFKFIFFKWRFPLTLCHLLKAIFLFFFFSPKCFACGAGTSSGNLSLQNHSDVFLVWYLWFSSLWYACFKGTAEKQPSATSAFSLWVRSAALSKQFHFPPSQPVFLLSTAEVSGKIPCFHIFSPLHSFNLLFVKSAGAGEYTLG